MPEKEYIVHFYDGQVRRMPGPIEEIRKLNVKSIEEAPMVVSVEIGEEVEILYPGATPRTVKEKVLAPCEEKHNGHWYCVTHREHFANQFMKDTHIGEPGTHKMAWICHLHGVEKP